MAECMEHLEDKINYQGEQLQQLTNYQYACNISIEGMMRMLAIGMAVDMDQFPRMPPFSSRPLAEDHGSSQPMDGSSQPMDEEGNENEDDEEGEDME